MHSVSEGYFEAMGAEMADGRAFTRIRHADGAGVVIVNETFAPRYLAQGPAVGPHRAGSAATGIGPLGLNLMANGPSRRARRDCRSRSSAS